MVFLIFPSSLFLELHYSNAQLQKSALQFFFFFFGSLIFYYFPYILEDFPCLSVCSLNPPNYFQDLTSVLDTSLRSLLIVHLRARTES